MVCSGAGVPAKNERIAAALHEASVTHQPSSHWENEPMVWLSLRSGRKIFAEK